MINRTATKNRHLAEDIENALRQLIENGEYAVGDKLPTVNALGDQFGVSRTVIREALAALRAAGLVVSRRGSGVFVGTGQVDFTSDALFTGDWPKRVPDVIDVLELRAAVEIQSAMLASTRASNVQLQEVVDAHRSFVSQVSHEEPANTEDFQFHTAIARATNNKYFEDFLSELGRRTIPRENLSLVNGTDAFKTFMSQLVQEHERIVHALEARDPEAAAEAMRVHLLGSLHRYRRASQK